MTLSAAEGGYLPQQCGTPKKRIFTVKTLTAVVVEHSYERSFLGRFRGFNVPLTL